MSPIERFNIQCPFLGGSFIRGSTVQHKSSGATKINYYQLLCKRAAHIAVCVVQTDVSLPVTSVEVVGGGKGSQSTTATKLRHVRDGLAQVSTITQRPVLCRASQ